MPSGRAVAVLSTVEGGFADRGLLVRGIKNLPCSTPTLGSSTTYRVTGQLHGIERVIEGVGARLIYVLDVQSTTIEDITGLGRVSCPNQAKCLARQLYHPVRLLIINDTLEYHHGTGPRHFTGCQMCCSSL